METIDEKCLEFFRGALRTDGGGPLFHGPKIYFGPAKDWKEFDTPDFQSFAAANSIGPDTAIQIHGQEAEDIFQVFIMK